MTDVRPWVQLRDGRRVGRNGLFIFQINITTVHMPYGVYEQQLRALHFDRSVQPLILSWQKNSILGRQRPATSQRLQHPSYGIFLLQFTLCWICQAGSARHTSSHLSCTAQTLVSVVIVKGQWPKFAVVGADIFKLWLLFERFPFSLSRSRVFVYGDVARLAHRILPLPRVGPLESSRCFLRLLMTFLRLM